MDRRLVLEYTRVTEAAAIAAAVMIGRGEKEEADARALLALADGFDAGIPLNELLKLAQRAGAGGRVAYDLYRGAPRVRDGDALDTIWQAVPTELAHHMDVAEKTGELSDTCRHAASRLRFDVEQRRKRLAAILPVVAVLIIGAIIGFRVITFYVDAYSKAMNMGH
jgi:type II secretory pathway component PulF